MVATPLSQAHACMVPCCGVCGTLHAGMLVEERLAFALMPWSPPMYGNADTHRKHFGPCVVVELLGRV